MKTIRPVFLIEVILLFLFVLSEPVFCDDQLFKKYVTLGLEEFGATDKRGFQRAGAELSRRIEQYTGEKKSRTLLRKSGADGVTFFRITYWVGKGFVYFVEGNEQGNYWIPKGMESPGNPTKGIGMKTLEARVREEPITLPRPAPLPDLPRVAPGSVVPKPPAEEPAPLASASKIEEKKKPGRLLPRLPLKTGERKKPNPAAPFKKDEKANEEKAPR